MSGLIRSGALISLVAVLACGRTTGNEDPIDNDSSAGGTGGSQGPGSGGTATTAGNGSGGGGSGGETTGPGSAVTATVGATSTADTSSGGVGAGGNTATVGSTGTAAAGGIGDSDATNGTGGSSAGAAGEAGTGGTGSQNGGCQSFTRIFEEESCLACRMAADATCEIHFWQTEMACGGSYQCFLRNCALSCGENCEDDTCACIDSCLPTGPSECRDEFAKFMDCYADLCGDC